MENRIRETECEARDTRKISVFLHAIKKPSESAAEFVSEKNSEGSQD
jgi:hypothetical protein